MTHPDHDLLVATALGEAVPEQVSQHLEQCSECGPEVESLKQVIDMTRRSRDVDLVPPPPAVWAAIEAELDAPLQLTPRHTEATPTPPRHGAPRRSPWWLAAAAAAGIALGSGVTAAVVNRDSPAPTPSVQTVAKAPLDTLDTKTSRGEARLVRVGTTLDLDVQARGLATDSGYLEVWLINSDLKRMVSVGVLPAGVQQQRFVISQELIDQGYVIVDISREQFDDKPAHSGDSLVRGTLAV